MELWDLYDAERKPLGRTHVRGEEFAEGEYYVCCEIWVINSEGKFLTTKRHPDKKAGNQWEFVGGGTFAGETTLQSAVRELQEETGIKAEEQDLKFLSTYAHNNYFMDIYVLKSDVEIGSIVLQPEEAIDVKWATGDEIQAMIDAGEFVRSVGGRYGQYKEDALKKAEEIIVTKYGIGTAVGMCLGVGVGLAVGISWDNVGMGLAIGAALGMCFGVALDARKRK